MAATQMQVNPDHLVTSAVRVNGHAEYMQGAHASADSRLTSALPGWPDSARAAMAAKAAEWQRTTHALCGRMADHSRLFTTSAADYDGTENGSAKELTQ